MPSLIRVFIDRDSLFGADCVYAGIINHDIQLAKAFDGMLHQRVNLIGIAYIAGLKNRSIAQGLRGFLAFFNLEIGDNNRRTVLVEIGGDGLTDALGRAGNNRDSAIEVVFGCHSSISL